MKIELFTATLCIISVAAQDLALVRTQPDPEQLPCPQQQIKFDCQINVPSHVLIWDLPMGQSLEFGVSRNVGDVRNSSDNSYSATLTGKINDQDTGLSVFNSTLLVLQPVNTSTLTCKTSGQVEESSTITISGTPDPPSDLDYNDGVVILMSVDLQWTRPSYTGGIQIANYTIRVNERTWTVKNESERVQYFPGLVYGEVKVSTTNVCGQESQPATINIPAKAIPQPTLEVQLTCEEAPSSWKIIWEYKLEKGIVYPEIKYRLELTPTGDVNSNNNVVLTNGDPACSSLSPDGTICTVELPSDIYAISLTLTNDIGSTEMNVKSDTRALIMQDMIEVEAKLSLGVTVNSDCPKECPVSVAFGTSSGNNCNIQQNATGQNISPGETSTFSVDADSVILQPREYYCYRIRSPCGNFDGGNNDVDAGSGLSPGPVAVIFMPVLCLMFFLDNIIGVEL